MAIDIGRTYSVLGGSLVVDEHRLEAEDRDPIVDVDVNVTVAEPELILPDRVNLMNLGGLALYEPGPFFYIRGTRTKSFAIDYLSRFTDPAVRLMLPFDTAQSRNRAWEILRQFVGWPIYVETSGDVSVYDESFRRPGRASLIRGIDVPIRNVTPATRNLMDAAAVDGRDRAGTFYIRRVDQMRSSYLDRDMHPISQRTRDELPTLTTYDSEFTSGGQTSTVTVTEDGISRSISNYTSIGGSQGLAVSQRRLAEAVYEFERRSFDIEFDWAQEFLAQGAIMSGGGQTFTRPRSHSGVGGFYAGGERTTPTSGTITGAVAIPIDPDETRYKAVLYPPRDFVVIEFADRTGALANPPIGLAGISNSGVRTTQFDKATAGLPSAQKTTETFSWPWDLWRVRQEYDLEQLYIVTNPGLRDSDGFTQIEHELAFTGYADLGTGTPTSQDFAYPAGQGPGTYGTTGVNPPLGIRSDRPRPARETVWGVLTGVERTLLNINDLAAVGGVMFRMDRIDQVDARSWRVRFTRELVT